MNNESKNISNDIYFDNAATTKPHNEIVAKANEMNQYCYGNPSSLHSVGFFAEKEMTESKKTLANLLNVSENELLFTSGGTESNNLAIQGVAYGNKKSGNHIITNLGEHSSVLQTYRFLEKNGFKVTYLPLNAHGAIDLPSLENAIENDTILISIMHVNNEIGTIQDISKIYNTIKNKNQKTLLHVDGVQGFGKIPLNLKYTDLYSFSAHKIHGFKGIGGLYVKNNVKLEPMIHGGHQQHSIRPGTENTCGIATLSLAGKIAFSNMDKNFQYVLNLKSHIVSEINKIENTNINSDIENGSPYILNISFLGVKSENLMHSLEQDGIYVSAGATCNSKSNHKSILANMGVSDEISQSAIRVSFSPSNNMVEAEKFMISLNKNIEFLRRFSK